MIVVVIVVVVVVLVVVIAVFMVVVVVVVVVATAVVQVKLLIQSCFFFIKTVCDLSISASLIRLVGSICASISLSCERVRYGNTSPDIALSANTFVNLAHIFGQEIFSECPYPQCA